MSERAVRRDSGQQRAPTPDIYDLSEAVTAREAAAMLGVSERTIRRAIDRGEVPALKHGRSFHITRTVLDEYQAARNQPRRRRGLHLVPRPDAELDQAQVPPPLITFPGGELAGRRPLPSPLSAFVGRGEATRTLASLLRDENVRLVTLTGPGGVGKTRLALHVASEVEADFAHGAVFVTLAALRDPALIPGAIVQALGLRESESVPAMARVTSALRERRLLLVFDNFEHLAVPVAGAMVAELLESCPGLKVLITSRTLLHLSGEHAIMVPPLGLPGRVEESRSREVEKSGESRPDGETARRQEVPTPRDPDTLTPGTHHPSPITLSPHDPITRESVLEKIAHSEAVQLFVDRARAAWSGFTLSDGNAPAVAAICERVDGLPLAIELAAARSAVLSPAMLLARLERRLPLLSGGPRDQPDRLRTMRDAIAWSYDLLDEAARARFRRFAVFAGGFPLEAAEFVGSDERYASTVVDAMAALVAGSLLHRGEQPDGLTRFSLLETVREFALEQLQREGEEDAALAAHAAWCLAFMEAARPELRVATSALILDQIEMEHDNFRAAMTWALEHDAELALRLASELGPFWSKRCHWSEGRGWLKRTLQTGAGERTPARAIAASQAGLLATDQSDHDEAQHFLRMGLAMGEQLGDARIAATALRGLGIVASNESAFVDAERYFSQALEGFRTSGDKNGIARCLNDLGLIASRQGDQDRAIALQEESLPIARGVGDDWHVCIVLGNLGGAYYDRGDYARGEVLSREALDLSRQLGDTFGVAVNLYNLGNCVLQSGDTAAAFEHYRDTLLTTRELGEQHLASRVLDRLAIAMHKIDLSRPAARLFGAAAALREAIDDHLFAEEETFITARMEDVRGALGEGIFVAAWESGRTLPLDVAMKEALGFVEAALPLARAARVPAMDGLTRREQDVLRLVADGRSDREIADALFVTRRSASKYVSAVLSKLGVASRTAAAALVLRQSPV